MQLLSTCQAGNRVNYSIALRLTLSWTRISRIALNFFNNISTHMVNYNWQIFTPDKIKAKSQAIVYKIKSSGEFWPFLLHEEKQEQTSIKLLSDTFTEDFSASVNDIICHQSISIIMKISKQNFREYLIFRNYGWNFLIGLYFCRISKELRYELQDKSSKWNF